MNQISTLEILRTDGDDSTYMTEDMTFTARQAARHVCVAFKKYFEAHLAIKVDTIRRDQSSTEGASSHFSSSANKVQFQL